MQIARIQQGAIVILELSGAMVAADLAPLEEQIETCIHDGVVRVVLDLRHVPFIDSAGLERIQALVSDLGKRGGDLRVTGLNEVCRDIFLATRIDSLVQVAEDRDAALRSLL